jgi:hypothetical protein
MAICAAAVLIALAGMPAPALPADTARDHDYPTATRADYVIGCMAANGNTREALLKCSCAIDTIAGLMPYADYERAETALSLQLGGGVGGRIGAGLHLRCQPHRPALTEPALVAVEHFRSQDPVTHRPKGEIERRILTDRDIRFELEYQLTVISHFKRLHKVGRDIVMRQLVDLHSRIVWMADQQFGIERCIGLLMLCQHQLHLAEPLQRQPLVFTAALINRAVA